MSHVRAKIFVSCVVLTAAGCIGSIGAGAADPERASAGPAGPGEMSVSGPVPGADKDSAGPWALQRLTTREYNNTVRQLLGLPSYQGIALPSDALGASGFVSAGDVTALHAQTFLETAEDLSRAALQAPSSRLVPCSPASAAAEEPCAVQFIRDFGKRAFRRPLGADEVADLTALYRQARGQPPQGVGYGFADAIGLLLQRFLLSPNFLYHRERNEKVIAEGTLLRLGPYEVASRLSYLLWETMPDDRLFSAADAGRLSTAAQISAEVARMLADKRAQATLASFHAQWLGTQNLGRLEKDAAMYPTFAVDELPSLEAELAAFVDYVFKGDARLSTLLTAPVAFATPATAKLYGLPAATIKALKPGMSKIDLDPTKRAGLLTQLAFLASNAKATGSNPVTRGLAIWKRILCGQVQTPPANVPEPRPPAPNLSTRERFAEHERNPCATCHQVFDPPGFAFEHYDAVGGYRTTDGGKPVDSSGALTLPVTGRVTFGNAVDLMQRLAATEEARRCVVRQWFRYALGRAETDAEEGAIEAVFRQVGSGESLNLKDLVLGITGSRSFLLRAPSPGELP